MVHLSPDSRLLVSLVKQEQAYAAQLHNLLNSSGTSLSALAVYASSSPPTVSPILNGVVGALSGADEALRTYGEAVNDWIDQLRSIKLKEEEVANIGRDREILVTRLLKVSQKTKSPPPSLLHAIPDTSSSSSFPTFNSKITAAQTELQACESHLSQKERELDSVRMHAVKQGLKLRCGALVQCGWVWGEMGRRALSMVDELNAVPPPANGHAPEFFKPLPDPTVYDHDRDSVLSSLSPSQSASQTGHGVPSLSAFPQPPEKPYRLDIPPPHLVSDHTNIPDFSAYPSHQVREPEQGNSSSEDEGPVEVHENPRFQPAPILNRQKIIRTAPSTPSRGSPVPFPSARKGNSPSSDLGPSNTEARTKQGRTRKHTGLFGSLAILFKTSMTNKSSPSRSGNQWSTRTDHNLRSVKSDGEQSSDNDEEPQPRRGRLRKGKGRAAVHDDHQEGWGNIGLVGVGSTPLSIPSPPTTPTAVKKKTSGGRIGRSGTIRSTISEPPPAQRVRANTLTSSSSGAPLGQSGASQGHGRTASVEGKRRSVGSSTFSATPLHSSNSTPAWKPPTPTTAAKGDSLMSIVEGVSRSNKAAWARAHDDPSSTLEVVRAPRNDISGLPLLVHPPPPLSASASAPSSPTAAPALALKRASMPVPPTPALHAPSGTEKKPLRSAMRNPNRDRSVSPAPSHSPNTNTTESEQSSSPMSPLLLPGPASPTLRPVSMARPEIPSTIIESPRQSVVDMNAPQTTALQQPPASTQTDDTASISSYETGRESLDDDESEPSTPLAPAPPPASEKHPPPSQKAHVFDASPVPNGIASTSANDQHELSSATSTDTATATRRKSVRMSSLPPQVSATPPALDEYEDADRSPWGKSDGRVAPPEEGWKSRIPATNIGWDDSSSEDEEYKAARRALSRANRQSERKKR